MKRARSEKHNLEQHILGMESEMETMQVEKTRLDEEMETQKRTCSGMEQQIETHMTEVRNAKNLQAQTSTWFILNFLIINIFENKKIKSTCRPKCFIGGKKKKSCISIRYKLFCNLFNLFFSPPGSPVEI